MTDSFSSDDVLLRLVLDGDRAAFEQLAKRHYQSLWSFAYVLTGDHDAALDIVQDIFHEWWLRKLVFDQQSGLRTWLLAIARHKCVDWVRRRARERHMPPAAMLAALTEIAASQLPPLDALLHQELLLTLQQEIGQLEASARHAILLRLAGCTFAEIAALLQLPPTTVKNHMSSAIQQLQKRLKN